MTKIVILVDYPGKTDLLTRNLLSGATGRLFWDAWNSSDLKHEYDKQVWSVLPIRPGDGKLESLCVSKKEAELAYKPYPYNYIKSGKWLHPKYFPYLEDLARKLKEAKPNLVLALGPLACWAMIGDARLTIHRGTCSVGLCGIKTLPSINPASLMRDFSQLPILSADLLKAARESQWPEVRRPKRTVLVPESKEDLDWACGELMKQSKLSLDIETIPAAKQITCVGFGLSPEKAIVFPFTDKNKESGHYWDNPMDEVHAWCIIKQICKNPKIEKVLQNGLYDLQWLWRICNIPVFGFRDDTMILHHCLYPELQKSLGFLGSIYTNEGSWKLMRRFEEKELK